jgi:very-short-patch-repair endonuclease
MTIAEAESLGLVERKKVVKPRKPKEQRIPNPPSKGEETLALHLKAHNINFRREYMFHPTRNWKLDFAIKHVKLAVEVEGAVEKIGRHQRPEGFVEDMYKYNALIIQGWRLLRFSTKMVLSGEAIDTILEALGMGVFNVTGSSTENC